MIIVPFQQRFRAYRANGINITVAFDIGAYRGDFTATLRSVWPECTVFQFEADGRQSGYLDPSAIMALLGDVDDENVNFYTLDSTKITTGSSIYLENTAHYTGESTLVLKKTMTTIDTLSRTHDFSGDWYNSGLIKLDTQGSELRILRGATKFLEQHRPRYILCECSVVEYNTGAPSADQVISAMSTNGYALRDIFDTAHNRGMLLQADILFERKT